MSENRNDSSERQRAHCIRCLLEDIDPEQYEKDIARILKLMDRSEKAPDTEYQRRLQICRECSYLSRGTCNACGCYVELRAAGRKTHCTYRKW